jgi:O-antigen/teichoic acid export membrane protein
VTVRPPQAPATPQPGGGGEHRVLLRGTAANVVGLAAGVASAFGIQLLLGRRLPAGGLGLVTVAVQVAFVASAGSRFGMDMTAIRRVAIDTGTAEAAHLRSLVDRAAGLSAAASAGVAALVAAGATLTGGYRDVVAIGCLGIPAIAAANVYLGATRGLKLMTPTLWVFWIGQPLVWIALAVVAIGLGGGTGWAVAAYDASWLAALVSARSWWRRLSAGMGDAPATPEMLREAVRYGLPRAPSALLAQALFWGDLFVLGHFAHGRRLDSYAAAGRVSQVLLLFLTSVSLIFSPFAADLHARGRTARLDRLFKDATRWALAATLPALVVLFVDAREVLRAFGHGFSPGVTPLRIMLVGQAVNVATGSVASVLVMVGRTGLDLIDNLLAAVALVAGAAILASSHGLDGAAVASAVTLAGVNLVRLAQVARVVGVRPLSLAHLGLLLPTAGCSAVAVAVHSGMDGRSWWAVLGVTAAAALVAYGALLVPALPAHERAAVRARLRAADRHAP